jgi:hypothetical protein
VNSTPGAGARATDATGATGARPGRAPADGGAGAHRRRPRRRLLAGAGWTAVVLAAFAAYLRLAATRAVNSDGAAQALQAWDMLHGNALLAGWRTSDVSFYTTELPQYMLVELARGIGQDAVHVAAAMTYTLAVLLAALVAAGSATGREALARAALAAGIMLAPQLDSGTNVLVSSPDHIGTSVPLLLAWLVIDRARPSWRVPAAVTLILAWALVADSIVLVAGVVPLAGVCAFRIARAGRGAAGAGLAGRWYEIALGGGALVAVGIARLAELILHALGGYTARSLGTQLASPGLIVGHNLPIAGQALLLLTGADFLGLPPGASTDFVLLHLAGAALAAAGIGLAAWRFGRRQADLVSQLLLAAIVVNVGVFVVTTYVYDLAAAREIAPALPFAAALAGRQLGPALAGSGRAAGSRRWPRRVAGAALGLVLAGYLAGFGLELTTPSAPPQAAPLTAWLSRHPIGTGLSGYWAASVVTLTSGGRAAVRPVVVSGERVVAADAEVKQSWFDPARSSADFVVLFPGLPGYPGFTDRAAVLATFGRPARSYRVGAYTIWWWPQNLLTELGAAQPG